MPSIDWAHSRRQLILPVAVMCPPSAPNPFMSVRANGLLDTGATASAFHPRVIEQLGLDRRGRRRVGTANGLIVAAEVSARLGFVVGDYRETDFQPKAREPYMLEEGILAFELLPSFDYDVLIGMDVIGQCDLQLRRDGTATLHLP